MPRLWAIVIRRFAVASEGRKSVKNSPHVDRLVAFYNTTSGCI